MWSNLIDLNASKECFAKMKVTPGIGDESRPHTTPKRSRGKVKNASAGGNFFFVGDESRPHTKTKHSKGTGLQMRLWIRDTTALLHC